MTRTCPPPRWIWSSSPTPITNLRIPKPSSTAVNRALKPGARLVIIEFAEGHPFGPQDKAERMSINQIRAEIEPLGFELDRVLELLPIQHGLIFTKRP